MKSATESRITYRSLLEHDVDFLQDLNLLLLVMYPLHNIVERLKLSHIFQAEDHHDQNPDLVLKLSLLCGCEA